MSVFSRLLNHIPDTTTVITWYRRSEGLAADAKIYVFDGGYGLGVLRNNAKRVIRGLSKDERLVLLDADKVDERFRDYAVQLLGSADLVFVADVASSPVDDDFITVCALLATAYNEEPAPKTEAVENTLITSAPAPVAPAPVAVAPKPAAKPRAKARPRAKSKPMAEPKSVAVVEHKPVAVAEFKPVPTEVAEPEPEPVAVVEFEPIAEPAVEPVVEHVAKSEVAERKPVNLPRLAKERNLFDDFMFEYAKACRDGGKIVVHRSPWSGELVAEKTVGDVEGLFQIGLLVIAFAFGLVVWSMIHFEVLMDFSLLMGSLGAVIAVWSVFMLWFNHRVKQIKKNL